MMKMKMKKNNYSIPTRLYLEGEIDGGGGGTEAPAVTATEVTPEATVAPSTGPDWSSAVPGELKEKPWMQSILKSSDPTARLLKDMDGLQSKLGQRVEGIPKTDAPQEEWDKFHRAMGRPDTTEDYEFGKTEWPDDLKDIGEFVDQNQTVNEDYAKVLKEVAFDLGLSKEKFMAAYNKMNLGFVRANAESVRQAMAQGAGPTADDLSKTDGEVQAILTKRFGAEADNMTKNAVNLMSKHLDDDARAAMSKMTPEQLAMHTIALNGVYNTYVKEDKVDFAGRNNAGNGETYDQARARARAIIASKAYNDINDPGHAQARADVDEVYRKKWN